MQNVFDNEYLYFLPMGLKGEEFRWWITSLAQQAGDQEGDRKKMNAFTLAVLLYVAGVSLLRC